MDNVSSLQRSRAGGTGLAGPLTLVGAGAAAALAYWGQGALAKRWARNPNPLAGESMTFPDGLAATVTTDDGARISVRRLGSGPTVVLLHGLTGNRDDWAPVGRRLAEAGFEVVAVEHRGHGQSTAGSDGFGVPRLAGDVAQVLSALNLRGVTLIGHSMGAMTAMATMTEHPQVAAERVERLAVVATAGSLSDLRSQIGLRALSLKLTDWFAVFDKRMRVGAGLMAMSRNPSLELVDHLIESTGRISHETRREATAALTNYDISNSLSLISVETLVVAGSRDRLTPAKLSTVLAERIPQSRLKVIDGGGHMMMLDRADELASLLVDFARIPGTVSS